MLPLALTISEQPVRRFFLWAVLLSGFVVALPGCFLAANSHAPPIARSEVDRPGQFVQLDFHMNIKIDGRAAGEEVPDAIDVPDPGEPRESLVRSDNTGAAPKDPDLYLFCLLQWDGVLHDILSAAGNKPVSLSQLDKALIKLAAEDPSFEEADRFEGILPPRHPRFLLVFAAHGRPDPADAPKYLPVLRDALHERVPRVRAMAASGLGHLGAAASDATPELQAALKEDPNPIVRLYAAQALSRISGEAEPALSTFVDALQSPIRDVPELAALFLGRMGPAAAPAVPALCAAMQRRESSGSGTSVRAQAIYALGEIGPDAAAAVPALRAVARDRANHDWAFAEGGSRTVRSLATEALDKITAGLTSR